MDELEIGGKKYLSSKRAAKDHRYHIDYIGQLIRAGRIVGKKVGRSWYVEDASLKNYLRLEQGLEPIAEASEQNVSEVSGVVEEKEYSEIVDQKSREEEVITNAELSIQDIVISDVPKDENQITLQHKEEVSAPLHIEGKVAATTKQVEIAPVRIPNTVSAYKAPTYVKDEEPMVPVLERKVRQNADFMPINLRKAEEPTAVVEQEQAYEEDFSEEKEVYQPKKLPKQKRGKFLGVLAATACLLLIAAMAASSVLFTNIKVGEGETTASVGVALP